MRRRFEKIPTIHNAAKRASGKNIFFLPIFLAYTPPPLILVAVVLVCVTFSPLNAQMEEVLTHTRAHTHTLMSAAWRGGEQLQ